MDEKLKKIIGWLKLIGIAIIISVLIENFFFSFAAVNGQSMLPTLETKNRLLVARLPYICKKLNRGDLIIFNPPNDKSKHKMFVKRVIANENDHFFINEGSLYINGEKQMEEYIYSDEYVPRDYKYIQGIVPNNMIFVMGDNRNDSNDSRMFGFVPKDNVKGKVLFKVWPLNEIQTFFTSNNEDLVLIK